jgi:hypothetical protein
MGINDYIDQLSAVKDILKEKSEALGVFSEIYHCYLEGCGEYWKLVLWKTTGQKISGTAYYEHDFNTVEDLVEHLRLLALGARIHEGDEL